ncbi:MAG: hypothetical protein ACSHW0_05915 [Thalassotalea sp.]
MKSKWNLVIHKTSQTQVAIWVGTLFPDLRKPAHCSIKLIDENGQTVATNSITRDEWLRPFDYINDRFYQYRQFDNLLPDHHYQVEFIRKQQNIAGIILEEKVLSSGSFTTLPTELATTSPFVIALGSCFYNEDDNGAASSSYTALYYSADKMIKPHVKFFTGDQVYLDIGLDSLSPVTKDVRKRIADDYASTWQTQRQMLRHGATWFLADDHEYWNNYPYTSGKNPYLWAITAFKSIKTAWTKTASCGVANVQQITRFDSFTIGNDISVCFADLRSGRDKKSKPNYMMPENEFSQLIAWAENLTCPGIIVLPQPLLVHPGGDLDFNIANYTNQYQRLVTALAASGHDIVCLSGDVHYGRIAKVKLGEHGATLHEIISSPMSNLTGLDGKVAASKAEKLTKFPSMAIAGITPALVQYEKKWSVSTQKVKFLRFFSYRKTREHFMTLALSKTPSGTVQMAVNVWRIRDKNKYSNMPKKDFSRPHLIELR